VSGSYKRAVRCSACGEAVKRAGHECALAAPPVVEDSPEEALRELEEIGRANRKLMWERKVRGRGGTHPGRPKKKGRGRR
jgi:hypothetical protein